MACVLQHHAPVESVCILNKCPPGWKRVSFVRGSTALAPLQWQCWFADRIVCIRAHANTYFCPRASSPPEKAGPPASHAMQRARRVEMRRHAWCRPAPEQSRGHIEEAASWLHPACRQCSVAISSCLATSRVKASCRYSNCSATGLVRACAEVRTSWYAYPNPGNALASRADRSSCSSGSILPSHRGATGLRQ